MVFHKSSRRKQALHEVLDRMAETPGYDISIQVDGRKLEEYETRNCGSVDKNVRGVPVYTTYVEAQEGENFAMSVTVPAGLSWPTGVKYVELCIDGIYITSRLIRQERYERGDMTVMIRGTDVENDNAVGLQPFIFTNLITTDDHVSGAYEEIADQLSRIRVSIYDCSPMIATGSTDGPDRLAGTGPVPERMIKGKAIDLKVVLGRPQATKATSLDWYDITDRQKTVDFIFKYRSRAGLEALGLIPIIFDIDDLDGPTLSPASTIVEEISPQEAKWYVEPSEKHMEPELENIELLELEAILEIKQEVQISRKRRYRSIEDNESIYTDARRIRCDFGTDKGIARAG
ncbi:hypothetical protein LTR66_017191 [Elasticomyces elasticus]|nr:hypothetical protein LTR66_017191 [Elasticomyces elasticus]